MQEAAPDQPGTASDPAYYETGAPSLRRTCGLAARSIACHIGLTVPIEVLLRQCDQAVGAGIIGRIQDIVPDRVRLI